MSEPEKKDKKELDQMAEDVKKAVGKEKADLVEKTIQETKERLAKEKELADMKAKLDELEKSREEEANKHKEDLETLKGSFKEETEKLVREFQDSRKSSINTDNPFNKSDDSNDGTPSVMEKYKSDNINWNFIIP